MATYNGWKNYETWAVKLWLDNEEPTQNDMMNLTRGYVDQLEDCPNKDSQTPVVRDLADDVEAYVDQLREDYGQTAYGLFADLISAALSEVDWYEIADSYLSDAAEGY